MDNNRMMAAQDLAALAEVAKKHSKEPFTVQILVEPEWLKIEVAIPFINPEAWPFHLYFWGEADFDVMAREIPGLVADAAKVEPCEDDLPWIVPAPPGWKWGIDDHVYKKSGSQWAGRIVGFYSTKLTPKGYAVESWSHAGSVQIYPEHALEAGIDPRD